MNKKNSLFFLILLIIFTSCDKKRVFDEYKSIGKTWHKDSIISFSFTQEDTLKPYNLFVNLRNNNKYPYNNLFLIVELEQPNKQIIIDTLEYQMANADGSILGDGFTETKESKLFYKEKYQFKNSGNYHVYIQHAVRHSGKITGVENLDGILDVGFRIESIE
jgi:gliding motility-associated lipoprotein GldH